MSITLSDLTSGYNLSKINSNFTILENAYNNITFWLSNGNNTMLQDIDLNSNNLLNAGTIHTQGLVLNDRVVFPTDLGSLPPNSVGTTELLDSSVTDNKISSVNANKTMFTQIGTSAKTRSVSDKLSEFVSVKDFGAKGDNVTDDTAAIQAALNASQKVWFPEGIYVVSATLVCQSDTSIIGTTPERCRLHRSTVYGDTLRTVQGGGALNITGIWFWHTEVFNNGNNYIPGTSNNILNKDPASCHINVLAGQDVRINKCWFNGGGTQIQFTDTAMFWVENCLFNGFWSLFQAGLQETVSSISCISSIPGQTETQLGVISNNHFSGSNAQDAPSSVTTGNVTVIKSLNCGTRFGIFVGCCESLVIKDNYLGNHGENSINISANGIVSHVRIHDNMFDSASLYSILITSLSNAFTPSFINIHNNTGVGYGLDQGFCKIGVLNDTTAPIGATQVVISDNNMQFYLRCPIVLANVSGARVTGNIVSGYNSDGSTNDDLSIESGCLIQAPCQYVHTSSNSYGGGVNNPAVGNNCKWGVAFFSTATCSASNERAVNLGLAGGTAVYGLTQTYPT